jgi:hypothetical protein
LTDFSIVNVALPTIQRELGMQAAELQWIVTGYALTFGSLLLAGGRLADLLGRRRLLAVGLVLFAVASLACGLAQWPVMLIVARVVQGAAGAMVSPAALSLLTTAHAEGPARTRALSVWQASTAAGATAGIIAGGLLTHPAAARPVHHQPADRGRDRTGHPRHGRRGTDRARLRLPGRRVPAVLPRLHRHGRARGRPGRHAVAHGRKRPPRHRATAPGLATATESAPEARSQDG